MHRYDRRYESNRDQRQPSQRDRDRVLYSDAFRRLGGVTQVVGPLEGRVFHNRLTHSLKVAQVARRLAETLRANDETGAAEREIHPEVTAAAGLAHDLGHPPFGHVSEQELDRLVRAGGRVCPPRDSVDRDERTHTEHGDGEAGDPDGFEGNAQSFRVLTRIAAHRTSYRGLNLTRATLNAVLKYPWLRDHADPNGNSKFGAYRTERADFDFAREGQAERVPSLEAQIMEVADDITYSVHDLEDFFRAGLIPAQLAKDDRLIERLLSDWRGYLGAKGRTDLLGTLANHDADLFRHLLFDLLGEEPYDGGFEQKAALRQATSGLIGQFLRAVLLVEDHGVPMLHVRPEGRLQMKFLQRLVWVYVIAHPRLSTQQAGQRRVIRELFCTYLRAIKAENVDLLPPLFAPDLADIADLERSAPERRRRELRLAADVVASLTDADALAMYSRFMGVAPGSVTDLLHV